MERKDKSGKIMAKQIQTKAHKVIDKHIKQPHKTIRKIYKTKKIS